MTTDKTTFYRWFRQTANSLGVPDVNLSYMSRGHEHGELGNYEPGTNTISIDERQLLNDQSAIHTALHEFAHAIVFKRNSDYLERENGKVAFNPNNPIATNNLRKLEVKGGHSMEWRAVATRLGVDTNSYVDASSDNSPFGQIRRGIGFKRS